jgi:hypothetical protein
MSRSITSIAGSPGVHTERMAERWLNATWTADWSATVLQTSASSAVEPNDYGLLLLLQQVRNDDSPIVQYFVCSDCLDLVESETGSGHVHDCASKIAATALQL